MKKDIEPNNKEFVRVVEDMFNLAFINKENSKAGTPDQIYFSGQLAALFAVLSHIRSFKV